jgi:hypothetical protein
MTFKISLISTTKRYLSDPNLKAYRSTLNHLGLSKAQFNRAFTAKPYHKYPYRTNIKPSREDCQYPTDTE